MRFSTSRQLLPNQNCGVYTSGIYSSAKKKSLSILSSTRCAVTQATSNPSRRSTRCCQRSSLSLAFGLVLCQKRASVISASNWLNGESSTPDMKL